jgi:integrase/recombinase XerD
MTFGYFSSKQVEEVENEDLIDFNNDYFLKNGLSSSYQNQALNGKSYDRL